MPSPEVPQASLRLKVDTDALVRNWRTLDAMSGTARAGAAVKANAYGLGAPHVVSALRGAGCRDFFVAHLSEVAELLAVTDPGSIAVLHGPMTADDARYAHALGIKPVINTLAQARHWLEAGGGACHVMVDTGMNRLGLAMADLTDPAVQRLEADLLMSHLASADEDVPLNALQQARWSEARGLLPHARASLANSAGIALGGGFLGDVTRPGISLYGGIPRRELQGRIAQVARPQAAIMQVRTVEPGEGVGYNAAHVASRRTRVGTIALGYADGYLRCWSGRGGFHRDDRALPVLGRISMDMTAIDLTDVPHLGEGDWVEADYSLPDAAAKTGLSQYELLTVLGRRFARFG